MRRHWWYLGAVVAVLALLAWYTSRPEDNASYREAVVTAATQARSNAATLVLVARADQHDRLLTTTVDTLLSDSHKALVATQAQFDQVEVPTAQARDKRQALHPLLVQAVDLSADLRLALENGDHSRVSAIADDLDQLSAALPPFAEGQG